MSCQKEITKKIHEKKADYVITLKDNQERCLTIPYCISGTFSERQLPVKPSKKGHGRIEKRTYCLLTERAWDYDWEAWTNPNGIGMVHAHVSKNNIVSEEKRYCITSLTDVMKFADAVRKHWSIENQLHRNLDVIYLEDAVRAKNNNSPLNMNILRKTALALVNQAKYGRISKKKMVFKAALILMCFWRSFSLT